MEQNTDLFAQKYKEVYQDMYRFALYTLKHREDAEDVVSETVLDAYRSIHQLRSDDAFRAWIFRILSNKCKRKLKSYITAETALPDELPGQESDTHILLDVRNAFFALDETDRMIISLHLFAGYKTKEIAQIMDMNEGTLRSRQSRALQKMKQQLA